MSFWLPILCCGKTDLTITKKATDCRPHGLSRMPFVYYSGSGAYIHLPWRRHQMKAFSASRALCAENSPVNSPHKGQWRGALMFSLIGAWTNCWANNRDAGDLRRHRAHNDVYVMRNNIHITATAEPTLWFIMSWCLSAARTYGGLWARNRYQGAGTSNYIPQHVWDVITYPCPWYLLLAHKASYATIMIRACRRVSLVFQSNTKAWALSQQGPKTGASHSTSESHGSIILNKAFNTRDTANFTKTAMYVGIPTDHSSSATNHAGTPCSWYFFSNTVAFENWLIFIFIISFIQHDGF